MLKRILRSLAPALVLAALPAISPAGVFISVNIAPPPLPVYVQPPCPAFGYIWVPGYWAWNEGAYYWVPGTWVLPPTVGLLWTPGYWGWTDGAYFWHTGYWGPRVGFYGGIDYGFGYDGDGFDGGYWRGREFYYNRAVWRVGPGFERYDYYHRPQFEHREFEHVSFNGGPRGVAARPTRGDLMAERERRIAFTPAQRRQERLAFADRALRADYNHGRPPIAATMRPAMFHGRGVVAARAAGGPVHLRPQNVRRAQAPMRSDRPPWATGQRSASGRMMQRAPGRPGQVGRSGRQFQPAPQRQFQRASQYRGAPQYRAPQYRAPQYRAPQAQRAYRGGFRPRAPAPAGRPVSRVRQPPRGRPPGRRR
jgi:hypothetical protein